MDEVFAGFLEAQASEGAALAARSPLVDLRPVGGSPPDRYLARFSCRGLVRSPSGEIVEGEHFEVGIRFPPDYLRRANPYEIVTWLGPREIFHPNVAYAAGRVRMCIGHLRPGTALVDIVMQIFEVISYQKVTMREDDALNHEACVWARANQHRFPIDERSLLGRAIHTALDGAAATEAVAR